MNDITRPIATETGVYDDGRAVSVKSDNGSSTSAHIKTDIHTDNSTNKPMPYIVLAIALSVLSMAVSYVATREAQLIERETRVMEDDLKYIRAYLSARGIEVPANHEHAEDK